MKYFDKSFWKMFFGFLAIVTSALVIMVVVKVYDSEKINVESDVNIAESSV